MLDTVMQCIGIMMQCIDIYHDVMGHILRNTTESTFSVTCGDWTNLLNFI